MKNRWASAALTFAAAILAGPLLESGAVAAENAYSASRITVESGKTFEEVSKALTSLVAKNGMMVMADVDQGNMLSMTGFKLKAHLFLVGNPTVGKQLFEQSHGVGLYVPIRVFIYTDGRDKTFVAYDKPSALLGQFHDPKIAAVAQMLDQKIGALASMAAQ
jgi:uncharacterized protein (DUF302 family)